MRLKFIELQTCRQEFESIQQRFEQLLQEPDTMVFVSKDAKIVFVNAQVCALFDYSEEELLGCDLAWLVPERY